MAWRPGLLSGHSQRSVTRRRVRAVGPQNKKGCPMSLKNTPVPSFAVIALVVLACALLLAAIDPPYAHPSQAESLKLVSVVPTLLLGGLGVWLLSRTPLMQRYSDQKPRSFIVEPLLLGAGLGVVAAILDATFGLSATVAKALGVPSIHLPPPYSILAYAAGGVAIESVFHLLPAGVVLFLVHKLGLSRRWCVVAFLACAALASAVEPATQTALLRSQPATLVVVASFVYIYGLLAFWQLWRAGPTAAIVMRMGFYAVWHIALGPFIAAA